MRSTSGHNCTSRFSRELFMASSSSSTLLDPDFWSHEVNTKSIWVYKPIVSTVFHLRSSPFLQLCAKTDGVFVFFLDMTSKRERERDH
jgi:hypothetical protein